MSGVETRGEVQAPAKTDYQGIRIGALILLSQERQIFIGCAIAQNLIPIERSDQSLHVRGANTGGIEASDQTTHACSRYEIDWNVLLLEPLQHADVRDAQGAAPLHCNADFQPRFGCGLRCLGLFRWGLGDGENGKHEEQKETKSAAHRDPPRNANSSELGATFVARWDFQQAGPSRIVANYADLFSWRMLPPSTTSD